MIILSTYKGPGDFYQLNAVRSWLLAFPKASIWLFYTEDKAPYTMRMLRDLKKVYLSHLLPSDLSESGTPILRRMFMWGRSTMADGEREMMWINSDIIIAPGAWESLSPALRHEEPFFMTGQRWDVEIDRFLVEDELQDIEFLKELARNGKLLPPCGADWFFFDKRLFHDLPPFRIGRCTFDQALIWDAIQKDVPHRFNMTEHVLALHQVHPEQSRTGKEFEENVAMMKEWYPNWTVGWDGWVNQLPAPTRIEL